MSLGDGIFKALYEEGAGGLSILRQQGVDEALFTPNEQETFRYIQQFFLQYGQLPSISSIRTEVGAESCAWERIPDEPLQYWIDQVKERGILLRARSCVAQLQEAAARRDIQRIRSLLDEAYISVSSLGPRRDIATLPEATRSVIAAHNAAQQAVSLQGVPFSFPFLNVISGGLVGGDIIGYIGRPSTSKSYLLLNDALAAHDAGFVVLFHSMEMPVIQCGRRLVGLRTGISPVQLRQGRVSFFGMERVEQELSTMGQETPFHLISGGEFGTVDDFHAQIKHCRPNIVYLDGAYLLRLPKFQGKRWERYVEVMERIKEIALSENIPIEFSYQFNRKDPGALEGISFTDSVGQLSSMIMGVSLERGEESGAPVRHAVVDLLKGREGETARLRIELNFRRMMFSQIEILSGIPDEFIGEGQDFRPDTEQPRDSELFERI